MAKVKARLRSTNNANERVHTRWGFVEFDAGGHAVLELDEADLPVLEGWPAYQGLAEVAKSEHARRSVKDERVEESIRASEEGAREHGEPMAAELTARLKAKGRAEDKKQG